MGLLPRTYIPEKPDAFTIKLCLSAKLTIRNKNYAATYRSKAKSEQEIQVRAFTGPIVADPVDQTFLHIPSVSLLKFIT